MLVVVHDVEERGAVEDARLEPFLPGLDRLGPLDSRDELLLRTDDEPVVVTDDELGRGLPEHHAATG